MCGAKVKGKKPTIKFKEACYPNEYKLLKQKEQDMKKNYDVSEDTENVNQWLIR